jgi:hypothetical protein
VHRCDCQHGRRPRVCSGHRCVCCLTTAVVLASATAVGRGARCATQCQQSMRCCGLDGMGCLTSASTAACEACVVSLLTAVSCHSSSL